MSTGRRDLGAPVPTRKSRAAFAGRLFCIHYPATAALWIGLAFLSLAIPTAGQLKRGDIEGGFVIGPGVAVDADGPTARYTLLRALGYSVTDAAQVGLALGVGGDFRSVPSSQIVAEARYYATAIEPVHPYLGLHAGAAADLFQRNPRVNELLGPGIGLKWGWRDKFLFSVEVRYSLEVRQPEMGVVTVLVGWSAIGNRDEVEAPPPVETSD